MLNLKLVWHYLVIGGQCILWGACSTGNNLSPRSAEAASEDSNSESYNTAEKSRNEKMESDGWHDLTEDEKNSMLEMNVIDESKTVKVTCEIYSVPRRSIASSQTPITVLSLVLSVVTPSEYRDKKFPVIFSSDIPSESCWYHKGCLVSIEIPEFYWNSIVSPTESIDVSFSSMKDVSFHACTCLENENP